MPLLSVPFDLPGFRIDHLAYNDVDLVITAHSTRATSICPDCGQHTARVHSHYQRAPRDLPLVGRLVRLQLNVRRFRCSNEACPRRIFAERLPGLLSAQARRTVRLTAKLTRIGFGLGGEAGGRLASGFEIATSPDTLLRLMRRHLPEPAPPARVVGVDDWAFRKGSVYGTILVDLERHQTIDLLPDRTAETLARWLRDRPEIEILSRDRSTEYARGASEGAPQARQVADRWHLLHNLKQAVERLLLRRYARLRKLPALPEAAHVGTHGCIRGAFPRTRGEQIASLASRQQRIALFEQVRCCAAEGMNIRQIARHLQISHNTVRKYVEQDDFPERARRPSAKSILDPYRCYLEGRLREGCENALQLWREIQAQGFLGTNRQVSKWMQQRRTRPAPTGRKQHPLSDIPVTAGVTPEQKAAFGAESGGLELPSYKQLSWLLMKDPDQFSAGEANLVRHIRQDPEIDQGYDLAQQFLALVRERDLQALDPWMERCAASGILILQNFVARLKLDYSAVRAALETTWSNGQTEGQVNRLKLIKRQMYGRAKFDLLRQRVLHAA